MSVTPKISGGGVTVANVKRTRARDDTFCKRTRGTHNDIELTQVIVLGGCGHEHDVPLVLLEREGELLQKRCPNIPTGKGW